MTYGKGVDRTDVLLTVEQKSAKGCGGGQRAGVCGKPSAMRVVASSSETSVLVLPGVIFLLVGGSMEPGLLFSIQKQSPLGRISPSCATEG